MYRLATVRRRLVLPQCVPYADTVKYSSRTRAAVTWHARFSRKDGKRGEKSIRRKEGKARSVRDAGEDVTRSEENSADKERGSQKEAQDRKKKHTREREEKRTKREGERGRQSEPSSEGGEYLSRARRLRSLASRLPIDHR